MRRDLVVTQILVQREDARVLAFAMLEEGVLRWRDRRGDAATRRRVTETIEQRPREADAVEKGVQDGETGAVCEPTPEALGAALSALVAEPARAVRLGRNARALLDSRGITWPATIEKLLA